MSENGIEMAAVQPSADTSTTSNGQTDANGGSLDSRIRELSQIIVHEMTASRVPRPPRPEIYRVPEMFLAADKNAYQPRFLSLGPYHCGDCATDEMRRNDEVKPESLDTAIEEGGPSVEEYMKVVASIEADARRCYDRDITMEWDAFCRMLLLDGFQLMALLEWLGHEDVPPEAAASPGDNDTQEECRPKTAALSSMGHDLMMLENQIPLFVVDKMYCLRYGIGETETAGREAVSELAWRTIGNIMYGVPSSSPHPPAPAKCQHLVQLCHVYLEPTDIHKSLGSCEDYGRFRRATEYYEAGVKFRPLYAGADKSARCPLLDVTFSNGVLRMAHHKVDERTNYILRNVLVYEQRYHDTATSGATGYVTAYVVFMSQLLGGPEDVALLSRRRVIEHHLGNDAEVCAMFRGLAQGLVFDPSSKHYLNMVGVNLHAHYRSRLNRWCAWVRRYRFGNPWLAVAWVFGAMAVLGTIIQTVIALLTYVYRR
ncbi:hypothetical protein ACQJBY_061724 [Aegilops geniculata]